MSRRTFEEYKDRREKYLGKILEYEELFRRDPDAYFRKANLVRLSGYLVYGLIVSAVGTILFAIVWGKFFTGRGKVVWGAFLGYILFQLLRAPLSIDEEDFGLKLEREDAPALFDLIESIAERMGGINFQGIWVDDYLNASAATRVINGFTQRPERHLVIGLPLLELLSREEVEGVIAHELGHFRGAHGEKGRKLGHTQSTLEFSVEVLEKAFIGKLLRPLSASLIERLDVLFLAARREQEFQADSAEIEQVGAEAFKRVGVKLVVFKKWYPNLRYGRDVHFVRQGWPGYAGLWRRAQKLDRTAATGELWEELQKTTKPTQNHPALPDRLRQAGFTEMPSSEDEVRSWIDDVLDEEFESAMDAMFTSEGRKRVRDHFEHEVKRQWDKLATWAAEKAKDDGRLAIPPEAALNLNNECSGSCAIEFWRRLDATDRVYGRSEYVRRLRELAASDTAFHRFHAIQRLWPVDPDLYEGAILSLASVRPYEDYAAYLLFNLLEHLDRLDEAKQVYEFRQMRKLQNKDFRDAFARGPRAMEVRRSDAYTDLVEYMTVSLTTRNQVSALYVLELRPVGSDRDFEPVFLLDYLSKREAFWNGGDDYSAWTEDIAEQTQCPAFVFDLCAQGDKWRKFLSDPRVRTLIPYRDPVRDKKDPFWKKFLPSK